MDARGSVRTVQLLHLRHAEALRAQAVQRAARAGAAGRRAHQAVRRDLSQGRTDRLSHLPTTAVMAGADALTRTLSTAKMRVFKSSP